jgi:ABC-type transport system involved in cytochrome bd biosynthesis fused ATPase/permease subunit
MMINKRLINTVPESKKYVAGNVALQWVSLISNAVMIFSIGSLLQKAYESTLTQTDIITTLIVSLVALVVRYVCSRGVARMNYLASKMVKRVLREKLYSKLLRLGNSYREQVSTSEVVQVSVEGVDQLETYFGAYLPQFFYSMIAPITLFVVVSTISLKTALVLLVCVPMIPIAIATVQKIAKKLLSKYWGQYTTLGDTFLENLQGLTTLKIYQADEYKHKVMNEEAEKFRKVTMKVLTMQLNSTTIMDLVAYGGSALGIIMAVKDFNTSAISFSQCFAIIMLSADFFIPMRQLGSYFHVAMNGMSASDKIFKILDLPEVSTQGETLKADYNVTLTDVNYSYDGTRNVLNHINMSIPQGSLVSIVGESGCGKSTIASILMGRNRGYQGSIKVGGVELSKVSEGSLVDSITYISYNSYIFKGSVRDNLLMGKPTATDSQLWEVLERTKLSEFLKSQSGLDTQLLENATNLSGGQKQRLTLARALLHDTPIYIFDEATSNIDVESENDIMEQVNLLKQHKTIVLISHRLANVVHSDRIYTIEGGTVAEYGTHEELLSNGGVYSKLWNAQQVLENVGKE